MKTMSVEEIVNFNCATMPDEYQYPMQVMRDRVASSSLTQEAVDSCAMVFNYLYALAQGEHVSKNDVKQLFVDEVWGDLEGYINGDGHLLEEALDKLPTIGIKGE